MKMSIIFVKTKKNLNYPVLEFMHNVSVTIKYKVFLD